MADVPETFGPWKSLALPSLNDVLPCGSTVHSVILAALRSFGILAAGQEPPLREIEPLLPYLAEVLKEAKIAASYGATVSALAAAAATELSPRYGHDPAAVFSSDPQWTGDDLNQSPSAFALLQTIPADFQATDELLRFFGGEQWDRAQIKSRAGRPTLTVNMLPRIYALALHEHMGRLRGFESHKLKCWIAHRNRNAQMLYNYLVSVAAERAAGNPDARLISPEQAGAAARAAYLRFPGHSAALSCPAGDGGDVWAAIAMAAIDYYLKQPKVTA